MASPGIVVAPTASVRHPDAAPLSETGGALMRTNPTPPWALLLAGGDGRRLRPLTPQSGGHPRTKQICAILYGETLLVLTRRRAEPLWRPRPHLLLRIPEPEPYLLRP